MNVARKRRLEELRKLFTLTEVSGKLPPHDVAAETVAMYLNKKHGRPVVVPRDRRGSFV